MGWKIILINHSNPLTALLDKKYFSIINGYKSGQKENLESKE